MTDLTTNMKIKCFLVLVCLGLPIQFSRAQDAANGSSFSGKVLETTNAASYTYVLIDTGSRKSWAATTHFAVKVGDVVTINGGMPMANFHSETLNRDFDVIYFTGSITPGENTAVAAPVLPPGHPPLTPETEVPKVDLTGIKKASGGNTIAELFAAQPKLAGKTVFVRGKVVKYNSQIMGKNWLHIQDGSGAAEKNNNDLTLTTQATAKLGDTVLVTGKISTSKDFGGGYKYTVIIEDAKVVVE